MNNNWWVTFRFEDGEAIPEPRTIEAIKADPELADWRWEADLVLIPLLLDRASL